MTQSDFIFELWRVVARSLRRPSMGPMAADGDGCAWGMAKQTLKGVIEH